MQDMVKYVLAGHKKSMIKLYEANKNAVYSLCCLLLGDCKKAEYIATDVINEAWNKLAKSNVKTEEQFGRFVLILAARCCFSKMFGKETKQFKLAKTEKIETPEIMDIAFAGDTAEGMRQLKDALNTLDAPYSFVYILRTAGLRTSEISKIISQREAAVSFFYDSAVIKLSDILAKDESLISPHNVRKLYERYIKETPLPDAADTSCYYAIKARSKFTILKKKEFFLTIGAVVAALCIVGAVFALVKSDIVLTSSTDDSSTEGSADTTYTPTALDETLTYFADIEIENYGTVTVELDHHSAPVTAANFVSLAQDGFYDGLTFHRIIEDFMMQGGDPEGTGLGGSENTIVGEFTDNGYDNSLSHTRGAISMARSEDYNSASSQFFIVHEDSTHLDGLYAVFGYVTEGMDIVDSVCEVAKPTDDNGTIDASSQPVITSVTIRTEVAE